MTTGATVAATIYTALIVDDAQVTFEDAFATPQERAEAVVEALRGNYDQLEPEEVEAILADADPADPDAPVVDLHQALRRYEEHLDVHLGEVGVPAALAVPQVLHLVVTEHADQVVAEAYGEVEERREALVERCANVGAEPALLGPDALDTELVAALAARVEASRIALTSVVLQQGSWRPSIEHPSTIAGACPLPRRLRIVSIEDGVRSVDASPTAGEHRRALLARMEENGVEVDDPDATDEELACALAEHLGDSLRIDEAVLDGGRWTTEG